MNPELQGIIATRRSVRNFSDRPVPVDLVRQLLEQAVRAPSSHNRQPWRFVALGKGDARNRMAASMADRFARDLSSDGVDSGEVQRRVDRGRERLLSAPVLIILCMSMEDMDRYPDERRGKAELAMAVQSVALAAGHILLAAHAAGLGACWLCGPLFAREEVRTALGLPASWEPQGAIALGFPAEEPKATDRRPIREVSMFLDLKDGS